MESKRHNLAICIFGVVLVIGFACGGAAILTGLIVYPSECSGRRIFCDLLNHLYGIGGRPAASIPYFALAILLAACVVARLRRAPAA